jgi:transglutaminase-like putative cysteine protease
MNILKPSQPDFKALKRQTLLVIFICYFPHIATEPLWLLISLLAAIAYRLIADHFNYHLISIWLRFSLFIFGCVLLLYGGGVYSVEFLIRCLLIFTILKCVEINSIRDLKVLTLCNFFLMFAALIVIQELWIIIYLLIAILANLSIMLKFSATQATLKQIAGKSGQQLLIAIPISLLLFYIFPRIDPLWNAAFISKATTGFSETMTPGSISDLFNDDSVAMQITFKKMPILKGYWRGIILSFYTGESWHPTWYKDSGFFPLNGFKTNEIADYDIILEPNQKKWLFYEGYPVAGEANLLFLPNHGLIRANKQRITERFAYSLKVLPAPYQALNRNEYTENIQLPRNSNPRLKAWAKMQFAKQQNDINAFIIFLRDYIHQQPFWYTLTPPDETSDKNQIDSFWFDNQKGFCEHYAGAVAFILRAAGIPARVILGYQGGHWNPIANAITIQQNDAHAWLEYWQEGIGWRQLDPTAFIAPERIDQTIRNREINLNQEDSYSISELRWAQKTRFYLESVRFFSERWLLFYSQNTQRNLLQHVGFGEWNEGDLLQVSVGCMILFFILLGLAYEWWQKQSLDSLLLEYHLLQKEFQRFDISIHPSLTLKQQCKSLIEKAPALNPLLMSFFERYEKLRLKQPDSKKNKKETKALFKTLRHTLRRNRFLKFMRISKKCKLG